MMESMFSLSASWPFPWPKTLLASMGIHSTQRSHERSPRYSRISPDKYFVKIGLFSSTFSLLFLSLSLCSAHCARSPAATDTQSGEEGEGAKRRRIQPELVWAEETAGSLWAKLREHVRQVGMFIFLGLLG